MVGFTQGSIAIYVTIGLLVAAVGFISLNEEGYEGLKLIKNNPDPILKLAHIVAATTIVVIFWLPMIILPHKNTKDQ